MANTVDPKTINNIATNDLPKHQKALADVLDAYTSRRHGFQHFSKTIENKINELQILLVDGHKMAERLNQNDRDVIVELEKIKTRLEKDIRMTDGDIRMEKDQAKKAGLTRQKSLLEAKMINVVEGIQTRKKILNIK